MGTANTDEPRKRAEPGSKEEGLFVAIGRQSWVEALLLVEEGADLEAVDELGRTPLLEALLADSLEMKAAEKIRTGSYDRLPSLDRLISRLVESSDLARPGADNESNALGMAARCRLWDWAEAILERDPLSARGGHAAIQPVASLIKLPDDSAPAEFVARLVAASDLDALHSYDRSTHLHLAARADNAPMARALAAAGADLWARDEMGATPLAKACAGGNADSATALAELMLAAERPALDKLRGLWEAIALAREHGEVGIATRVEGLAGSFRESVEISRALPASPAAGPRARL